MGEDSISELLVKFVSLSPLGYAEYMSTIPPLSDIKTIGLLSVLHADVSASISNEQIRKNELHRCGYELTGPMWIFFWIYICHVCLFYLLYELFNARRFIRWEKAMCQLMTVLHMLTRGHSG